jgi:hypothetical protein
MAVYLEDFIPTPRDSVKQRTVRSGYTGPKNNRGEPDTTGTDEIGVMNYPPNDAVYERYSGQWKNGEPDGQGNLIYRSGDTYTGEFIDGAKHGRGVYKHLNGMVREGEFRNGVNVRGTLIHPDYTFQGTFVNEMAHKGMFTYKDGSVFTGIESKTKRVGTCKYPDGDVFSGEFTADGVRWLLNGYGEMIVNSMPTKFSYRGQFRNGVRHGKGLMIVNGGWESYSVMFDNDREIKGSRQMGDGDQEVRKSRENLPKQGGTRHKRTRCRRKGLKKSKRDRKKC